MASPQEQDNRIGKKVRVPQTGLEGIVTGTRDKTPLPSPMKGETAYLPPYIEINGEIQVHPTKCEIEDNFEDPEFQNRCSCDKSEHLRRSIAKTHHHKLR